MNKKILANHTAWPSTLTLAALCAIALPQAVRAAEGADNPFAQNEGPDEAAFHVAGGKRGTTVTEGLGPADATLRVASPLALFALASRKLAPGEALRSGAVRVEGDPAALDDFPELFDMDPAYSGPQPTGE